MSTPASVNGKLLLPDGTAPPAGSFVQLDLKNIGTAQPTVDGVAIYNQKQFTLSTVDGSWSGSLYRNDNISCNGVFNSVWAMTYFSGGRAVYPAKLIALAQASADLDTLPAINLGASTLAVPTPATGAESALAQFPNPASTWTCVHNFGTQAVHPTFYDSSWNEILPDTAVSTDVNTFTATFLEPQAGFMVVVNVGNWTPSVANPNNIIGNPTSSQSVAGDFPFTIGGSLAAKRIEGIRYADQFTGADAGARIAAAIADLSTGGGTVDARGFEGAQSIGTSVIFPNAKPVILLLGAATFSGPGPLFDLTTAAPGSAILGAGIGDVTNGSFVTKLKVITSGTDAVKIGLGTSQVTRGIRIENLGVDCNAVAARGFTFDTVQNSHFANLAVINATSIGFWWKVSATTADTNNSWNTLLNPVVRFTPIAMQVDNNAAVNSNFTQNRIFGADFSFSGVAAILVNGADNNWWFGTRCFRDSGTGNPIVLTSPSAGVFGGMDERFYGVLGGAAAVPTILAQTGTSGNEVWGYDFSNGQAQPSLQGNAELRFNGSFMVGPSGAQGFLGTHPTQWFMVQSNANNPTFSPPVNLNSGVGIAWNFSNGHGETDFLFNLGGGSGASGLAKFYKWDGATATVYAILPNTAIGNIVGDTATQTLTNKSTSAGAIAGVVASGTSTLTSNATLAAVTSQTAITTAATGALTADAIEWSYASAPGAGDSLCHVSPYVTSGNVNFVRSNPTAASQNVSAIVVNWRVVR